MSKQTEIIIIIYIIYSDNYYDKKLILKVLEIYDNNYTNI